MAKTKAAYIVCALGAIACFLQVIGSLSRQYTMTLSILTVRYIFGMKYVSVELSGSINGGANGLVPKEFEKSGTRPIEDVISYMCGSLKDRFFSGFCDGLVWAWWIGAACFTMIVINLCCQGVACFLIYDYSNRKQNPAYRESAATLILVCSVLLVLVNLLYFCFVLMNVGGEANTLVGSAMFAVHPSYGFVLGFFGLAVQIIQGTLVLSITRDDLGEEMYLANKEARVMEREAEIQDIEMKAMGGSGNIGHQQQQMGRVMYPSGMVGNQPMPAGMMMQPQFINGGMPMVGA